MRQSISIACIVFSDQGKELGHSLAELVGELPVTATAAQTQTQTQTEMQTQAQTQTTFTLSCAYGENKVDFKDWAREAFKQDQVLLFIGSCGIAVRAIAPLVKDKTSDPAVLVMDEAGQWVIPLLSGHIGGANRWAKRIAAACGATVVITTATDVRGVWAVDEWASHCGMTVHNPQNIKVVSAAMLRSKPLSLYSDVSITGALPSLISLTDDRAEAAIIISPYEQKAMGENVLHLVPACVNVGIGCRKGVCQEDIEEAFFEGLRTANVVPEAITSVHSIDIKKNEEGIKGFCHDRELPFVTHTAEELERVANSVARSNFVKETVGVDNVCERSALIDASRLICEKQVYNGITVAFAIQDMSYDIEDAK